MEAGMSLESPEGKKVIEKLKTKFVPLIRELGEAKLHFMFYGRLREGLKGSDFHEAWEFWNYTLTAHALSTLIHICRVYDDYKWREAPGHNALHLLRLVKEIEEIQKYDPAEPDQLKEDLAFLQRQDKEQNVHPNESVGKLREWRNNVICHRSLDLVLGDKDDYFRKNGFDDKEIQGLIENGFSILKRWASHYNPGEALRWIEAIEKSIIKEEVGALPAFETFSHASHSTFKKNAGTICLALPHGRDE
jgi:hypothetical protein